MRKITTYSVPPGKAQTTCADRAQRKDHLQKMRKLVVRRYTGADHEAVIDLHNRALNQVGANLGEGPWNEDLKNIERVYLDNGGEFLVGTVDETIVAMGAIRRVGDGVAEVKRMRVDPAFQRKGYGQRILSLLEEFARRNGYRHLTLDTTTRQTAAQMLYEKNGYRRAGMTKVEQFDVILYEKDLTERSVEG
jgi:ribosomal protein S18 acetylase RimI-like enzyme